jgi:four helix bundle protein
MHNPLRIQLLDEAVRIVELVRPTIEVVARHDRDLASQLRRALSSVALNVAEGFGSNAGNRRLRFDSARGSLYEAVAGIRIAAAWGHISAESSSAALAALDRLGARLYGVARR